jgi:hypothetical protein
VAQALALGMQEREKEKVECTLVPSPAHWPPPVSRVSRHRGENT